MEVGGCHGSMGWAASRPQLLGIIYNWSPALHAVNAAAGSEKSSNVVHDAQPM